MLHQEIKTYSLEGRSEFSPHFSMKKMEDLYLKANGKKPVPHRHDYYNIYFVEKGRGSHVIDFKEYEVTDRQLYFVLPGQMHQLTFTDEPVGRVVSFTEEFLIRNAIPDYLINEIYLFDDYGQSPPLPVNQDSVPVYSRIFDQIELFSATLDKFAHEAVGALLKLLLIQSNNNCSLHKSDNPQLIESTNHMLRTFKQLLNKHYAESHRVGDYADKLAVTPDYLNKTVKSITGRTAKDLIQSKLITEAKRSLVFSTQSNKELAYTLGFDESAHFNNFFKKNTGLTPVEFRQSLLQS